MGTITQANPFPIIFFVQNSKTFQALNPKRNSSIKITTVLILAVALAELGVAAMSLLSGGAVLSMRRCSLNSAPKFTHPIPPLFSNRSRPPKFLTKTRISHTPLTFVASADSQSGPTKSTAPFNTTDDSISFVGQGSVPFEGAIQFENPSCSSSLFTKWSRMALLAGGDVLVLLLFSAIGRFSHGFSVVDTETLRIADPFIAGWFLSAYFLGGYGEEGRGMNRRSKAIIAAAKSWSLGIPVGLAIRAATVGHFLPTNFIVVTMGSTAVLLIGWRALLFSLFFTDKTKNNDVYKHGSPFELFELLTSLVRRC